MQEKQRMEFEELKNKPCMGKLVTEESEKHHDETSRDYNIDVYQNVIEDKEARISDHLDQIHYLKNARDVDRSDMEALKSKYEKKKGLLAGEKEKTRQAEERNQQLLIELSQLRADKGNSQDMVGNMNKTVKDKDSEIFTLKVQLEEQISRNQLIKKELETYSREVKDMQNHRKASFYNTEGLHSENMKLKSDL